MTDDREDELAPRAWLASPASVGLPFGLLVAAPLFLMYEGALFFGGDAVGRNGAERMLTRALAVFGEYEDLARALSVLVLLVAALVLALRTHATDEEFDEDEEEEEASSLFRRLARLGVEGVFAAFVLGPVLMGLVALFDVGPEALGVRTAPAPDSLSLAFAARLVGAAVWEELLFRVLAYGLFVLFVLRLAAFFGASGAAPQLFAELVAMLGSSVVFAALHLEAFTSWLGVGGEPYDPTVFLWRLLAGLLLAGLFRWRGLGVTAWAHGLFNLALVLGVGPGVFG